VRVARVLSDRVDDIYCSVGHHIIDSLASRLGIRLLPDKYGFVGQGTVNVGEAPVHLTLFKSSKAAFAPRPVLILLQNPS
jgi:hypothetical protein